MKVVDWRKALILWFQDKVEILEFHTVFARSPSETFRLPSVLRLKRYVRSTHNNKITFCRENVYLRDDYSCQYCGNEFERKELTLDHIFPASKGGGKSWTNVVTACRKCNQKKGNRTPEQARMPLKKPALEPEWLPQKEISFCDQESPPVWLNYLFGHD